MALPIVPNIAVDRIGQLMLEAAATNNYPNAILRWRLLVAAGLQADTALQDYTTMSALLAAANDEATFTGYSKLVVTDTDISELPNNTANNASATINTDPSWDPTSAQAIGAIVLEWVPDSTSISDTTCVPLFIDTYAATTGTGGASTPFTYQVSASGLYTATLA